MSGARLYFWSALGLAALAFLGLNVFVDSVFTATRLDLTQNRQYTLTAGTRAIIAKLPEPVTLRFYFSRKNSADYPATAAYARRVHDLLGEYAARSHGKIILEEIYPDAFSPEEDRAAAAGLKAMAAKDGGVVYFGLEGVNSIDDKEVIPTFDPAREPYLEYDITSLLYHLSHPEKPKLAVLSSLPLAGAPGGAVPFTIYTDLQRDYDITMLANDFPAIPAGTSVLLIAHPEDIGTAQLKMIELFVLKGGKALIFVDPLSELAHQEHVPGVPPSSDLVPLLKGWGIDYTPLKLVLDRSLAQRIRVSADPQQPTVAYPIWLHLTKDEVASGDPVTASLTGLNLASAGALGPLKGATTHFTPLLWSSAQASLFGRDQAMALKDPGALSSDVAPAGKSFTLAARITGKAVFPGVTQGDIDIIVVADTDLLDDRFWLSGQGATATPFADNEGLVLNAVENLSGSADLASLRMRGNGEHPFLVVQAMQAAAELKFRDTLRTLQASLAADEERVTEMQQSNGAAMTPAIRSEIAATRTKLRQTQHQLHAEIDRLGSLLAFANVLLMPLLVAAFAGLGALLRRRRARGRPA